MSDIFSVGSVGGTSTTSSTSSSSQSTTSSSSVTASSASKDVLRITGMASGLDVDSIVSKLMTPYQQKIDSVKQDQQKILWKQQMYQKIISDIKSLQSNYFDVTKPSSNILSSSFYSTEAVDNTNTSAMTVTAGSSAINGAYSINVSNIASGAAIKGTTLNSMVPVNLTKLSDWQSGAINFDITSADGKTVTHPTLTLTSFTGTDINSLVNNMNQQIAGNTDLAGKISVSSVVDSTGTYLKFNNLISGNTVQVNSSTTAAGMKPDGTNLAINKVVSIGSNTTLAQLGLTSTTTDQSFPLTFNYSGSSGQVTVNVTTSETLGQLANAISTATGGAVYGVVDDLTGKFSIQTKATGSTTTLNILTPSSSTDLLNALGIASQPLSAQGQDAQITITPPQGQQETITETTNNFTLNGLTFKLLTPTTSGNATVTVSQDTDSVFNKFKAFMDQYNSIVNEIKGKLTEKVNYDYPPLTDAQKSSMSQSDIDAWNAKAQQGLLDNDDNLNNFFMELKNSLYQVVQGANMTLGSKLGLDLSSTYSTDGTLVFSDNTGDTFKQMLQDNPQGIADFFSQTQPSSNSTASTFSSSIKTSSKGILQNLNDVLEKYVGITGVTQPDQGVLCKMAYYQDNYSTFGMGSVDTFLDQIYQDNNQITKLSQTYDDARTSYYNKFSQLEQAITSLNAQASVLSSYGTSSG